MSKVALNIAITPSSVSNADKTTDNSNTFVNDTETDNIPKYNVKNVPDDFFSTRESCEKLIQLITQQELANENQTAIDEC